MRILASLHSLVLKELHYYSDNEKQALAEKDCPDCQGYGRQESFTCECVKCKVAESLVAELHKQLEEDFGIIKVLR
jgi:hypothetical protein